MVGAEISELSWRWQTVRATMQRPTQKSNMRTMIPVRAFPERLQKEADHQTHFSAAQAQADFSCTKHRQPQGKSNWERHAQASFPSSTSHSNSCSTRVKCSARSPSNEVSKHDIEGAILRIRARLKRRRLTHDTNSDSPQPA